MKDEVTVRWSAEKGLATLVLARPDKGNALSPTVLKAIVGACEQIEARSDLRVVVLRGEGRSFCVGFDLHSMAGLLMGGESDPQKIREVVELGYDAVAAVRGLSAITVASVHGHVVGGGMLLAAACDLRVAADNAVFSLPEVDLGLPLLWGGVPLLQERLGESLAMDLILTCRKVGLAELAGTHFIHQVSSEDARIETTQALVDQLLAKPMGAVLMTKAQFQRTRRQGDEGLRSYDSDLGVETIQSETFLTDVMSYLQRLQQAKS